MEILKLILETQFHCVWHFFGMLFMEVLFIAVVESAAKIRLFETNSVRGDEGILKLFKKPSKGN